jgi:hypothetical protein
MSNKTNKLPRLGARNEQADAKNFDLRKSGPEVGELPKYYSTGANIRIVTPAGVVVQSNPAAYRKLSKEERQDVIGGIMAAVS